MEDENYLTDRQLSVKRAIENSPDETQSTEEDDTMNDLVYLLHLLGDAFENYQQFSSNHDRALWVVSQWCQEVNVRPDLSDYETGETVSQGEQSAEHPRHPEAYGEDYR